MEWREGIKKIARSHSMFLSYIKTSQEIAEYQLALSRYYRAIEEKAPGEIMLSLRNEVLSERCDVLLSLEIEDELIGFTQEEIADMTISKFQRCLRRLEK